MKKIGAGFILAAFVMVAACNSGANTTANNTPASDNNNNNNTSAASPQEKTRITDIAYIRVDSVIQNYDMYHDLRAELEKKAKKLDAEFDAKVKAWQKDMTAFNEKAEKMLLTHSQQEEQGRQLQMRQKELMEVTAPKLREELMEEEAVMNRSINDAIQKYVDRYNADKNYSLILNGAVVLSGNRSMDITAEILKGLNQEYIATKAAKK
ncbi:MAG: OmpH family outer membrane protein [Prevotellaceae bacterium]|nr:OmpH family outer membrane protein [Prevotellaceae bacterium]